MTKVVYRAFFADAMKHFYRRMMVTYRKGEVWRLDIRQIVAETGQCKP